MKEILIEKMEGIEKSLIEMANDIQFGSPIWSRYSHTLKDTKDILTALHECRAVQTRNGPQKEFELTPETKNNENCQSRTGNLRDALFEAIHRELSDEEWGYSLITKTPGAYDRQKTVTIYGKRIRLIEYHAMPPEWIEDRDPEPTAAERLSWKPYRVEFILGDNFGDPRWDWNSECDSTDLFMAQLPKAWRKAVMSIVSKNHD